MEHRPIPGWPLYAAREDGVVVRAADGWPLSVRFCGKGYPVVDLRRNNRDHRKVYVHQLVCLAFHGEQPPGLECRHLDGDKWNSRPDNLEWSTHSVNMRDIAVHGTREWPRHFSLANGTRRPPGVMCGRCGAIGHTRRRCVSDTPIVEPEFVIGSCARPPRAKSGHRARTERAPTERRPRAARNTCGHCGSLGHNRRTCTKRAQAA